MFMLIPHIVRAQDVFDSNTRTIDVGTANCITLHRLQRSGDGPACDATGQAWMPAQPAGGAILAAGSAAASAPAGSALVSFDPANLNQAVGTTFTVNINLRAGRTCIRFRCKFLQPECAAVAERVQRSLAGAGRTAGSPGSPRRCIMGIVQVTASRPPGSWHHGNGQLFTLTFQAKAPGQATLSINRATEERQHAEHSGERLAGDRDRPLSGCLRCQFEPGSFGKD